MSDSAGPSPWLIVAPAGALAGVVWLARRRRRKPDDPAIALLDLWAVVADTLSYYAERIASEAYLRTASERRSVRELARLVGYRPSSGARPGKRRRRCNRRFA